MAEQKKLAKRHMARLQIILRAWDISEQRAQQAFGDRVKGSVRSSRWRDAEALRAAIALLADGVPVPDDSATVQQIDAPDAGPMPGICEDMEKPDLWAYAHLCGWRAAGVGVPRHETFSQDTPTGPGNADQT